MNLEQHYRTIVDERNALVKKIENNEAFIDNLCAEIQDPIEIELAKGKLLTMVAHLHNLNARIINLDRLLNGEEPNRKGCQVCGDGIATNHCGQDAAHYRAIIESQGIHIHEGNTPPEVWGDLKSLLGMEVIALTRAKCQSCPQDHYGTPCVKLELVGGIYICLAPKPQDNA